ncbi:MAG: PAS domain-containing protein [Acidobacteriota bacterium]|nr:PAS domain-containing protein [Acidobacteriota bacterium]
MSQNPSDTKKTIDRAVIEEVQSMSEEALDDLPFGAIRLDREGTILAFNDHESQLTGRSRSQVLGKNFFTEVAPCTNVQDFAGRFREGVRQGELHAVFPYLFDFKMKPRNVWVTLFYSRGTDSAWVFVREDNPAS